MNPKLSKWERWLEVIKGEVQDLIVAKHTFHEVQSMIRDNPKLQQHNSFYDYLTRTYVSHAVIGLRRQIKCDAHSISLARMFEEMIASPKDFSRKHYTAKYQGSTIEDFADHDFDKLSTPGMPHIDPTPIEKDLERLRTTTKRCEDFADKRIAHRDKRAPKQLPTYNEVDDCINLLDELYVKYFLLFHASSMSTLLPTWQYDWKAIFRIPWIEDEK